MGKVRLKSYEVTWFGDLSIELPPLELLGHHRLISFFLLCSLSLLILCNFQDHQAAVINVKAQ